TALRRSSRWTKPPFKLRSGGMMPDLRIGDLFTVRRGIATGANAFFILERDQIAQHGIPESEVRPILPKSRELKSDIVETMPDGYPRVATQLCVIDCDKPQTEIADRWPLFAEYLASAKKLGILERNLVRNRVL